MKIHFKIIILLFIFPLSTLALPLNNIKLPDGFKINIYANVPNARSMTLAPNGVVFVGTRSQGKVYALLPNKNHTQAKKVITIAKNLNAPNGVAYHDGALYVAEIGRIIKFPNILQHLTDAKFTVITDKLPKKSHHGWRYIAFSPKGQLYVAIGAPCNICTQSDTRFATIMRMHSDGSDMQVYAKGIRNSVGFDWHPDTKQLWFTDNGRDWLGDNLPPDELNFAPQAGMDFGFPYFYGKNIPDPKFDSSKNASHMTPATQNLDPHVAALGMKFYTGKQFPQKYWNQIFIAEHGSWNRARKIGYRITLVTLKNNKLISYEPFATGWLQGQQNWGRPVDLLIMPDGSMLVSDDQAGVVYRISY